MLEAEANKDNAHQVNRIPPSPPCPPPALSLPSSLNPPSSPFTFHRGNDLNPRSPFYDSRDDLECRDVCAHGARTEELENCDEVRRRRKRRISKLTGAMKQKIQDNGLDDWRTSGDNGQEGARGGSGCKESAKYGRLEGLKGWCRRDSVTSRRSLQLKPGA
eukprot:748881-Hanusia_phi.AAC.1